MFSNNQSMIESMTLTAGWTTITFTISYANLLNGTNPNISTVSYTVDTNTITFAAPTRPGYIGTWSTASIPKGSFGDKTITAVWMPIHYTISYANLLNGSNPNASVVGYTIESNTITFSNPTRAGYTGTWSPSSIAAGSTGSKTITADIDNSCVAEGTLITLADGTQKAVELLNGSEMLLVWNLHTGTFDSAPILFIDSHSAKNYEVISLYFSDGTAVKIIDEHAFWDFNLGRYLFLTNDAAKYIGHWFNKQSSNINGDMTWTAVQLTDVEIEIEYTTAWSPVTFSHLCYYVNGMLSMPAATEVLINMFAVDCTTMQYDQGDFEADIEEFGLFTFEEFAEIFEIPEFIFEAFNGQYLKVSIGKGLVTFEELGALIARYAAFFGE